MTRTPILVAATGLAALVPTALASCTDSCSECNNSAPALADQVLGTPVDGTVTFSDISLSCTGTTLSISGTSTGKVEDYCPTCIRQVFLSYYDVETGEFRDVDQIRCSTGASANTNYLPFSSSLTGYSCSDAAELQLRVGTDLNYCDTYNGLFNPVSGYASGNEIVANVVTIPSCSACVDDDFTWESTCTECKPGLKLNEAGDACEYDPCYYVPTENLEGDVEGWGINLGPMDVTSTDAHRIDGAVYGATDSAVDDLYYICTESTTGDAARAFGQATFEDSCNGGNVEANNFSINNIKSFLDAQEYEAEGDQFVASYSVECDLYWVDASEACSSVVGGVDSAACADEIASTSEAIARRNKNYRILVDNDIGVNIDNVETEEEDITADSEENGVDLEDLVRIVANNGETVVFREGQVNTLNFSVDALDANAAGVYGIDAITDLTFRFDDVVELVVYSGGEKNTGTFNYVLYEQEEAADGSLSVSFVIPSSLFADEAKELDITGTMKLDLNSIPSIARRNDNNSTEAIEIRSETVRFEVIGDIISGLSESGDVGSSDAAHTATSMLILAFPTAMLAFFSWGL